MTIQFQCSLIAIISSYLFTARGNATPMYGGEADQKKYLVSGISTDDRSVGAV